MSKYDDTPINTVRLSAREQDRLLSHVNQPRRSAKREEESQGEDRRGVRVPYQVGSIIVAITQRSGDGVRFSVVPRNISVKGLAFIHGQFLYPGTQCQVTLLSLDGERVQIGGNIRDCRHVSGLIHEVSVIFHEPIKLDDFANLNETQSKRMQAELGDRFGSKVDAQPDKMEGKVLVYNELESDRGLFGGWLRKLGLQVNQCGEYARAIEAARSEGVDVIVIDLELTAVDALKVVREFREKGFAGPIVATTADPTDAVHAAATAAGCNAVLGKPISRAPFETTVRQLCDPASAATPDGPIRSIYANDTDMQQVLVSFMADVKTSLTNLERAMRANDATLLNKLCKQLKVSATSYGYRPLADAACTAVDAAARTTPDPAALKASVDALIDICQRVRAD